MQDYFQKHKTFFILLSGAFCGLAAFLLINTAGSLNVTDDSWIMRGYVERDIIQHYTGWLFYRSEHIPFPLGVASGMAYPSGGAVAFSDSIPLVSILFGAFSDFLPQTFQFFGVYTLICYMLTGVSASLLLSLFFERVLPVLLGTVIFSISPVMIERAFRHTALASHYIIIFALYLYFLNRKKGFRLRLWYPVLCLLAVSIHFYFVPMIFAILFADLCQDAREKKRFAKHLLFLAANLLTVFFVAFAIGYFYTLTKQGGELGYGYFTMNLNALFNPRSVSDIRWSLFLPALGQGLGSAEGFNYLGLGVLLSLAAATLYYSVRGERRRELFMLIKRHSALFAVCVLLTLFAVSTTVVINNNPYLRIPLPLFFLEILSIFRSSGRLFWPVYYLLMLFSVVFAGRRLQGRAAYAALAALVVLQTADLFPAFVEKRMMFQDGASAFYSPTEDAFFSKNRGAFGEIFTLSDNGIAPGLYIAHYAAANSIKTNEPFMARNDISAYRQGGDAEFERLFAGDIDHDKLYVFGDVNRFFNAATALGDNVFSGRFSYEQGFFYIIASKNGTAVIPDDSALIPLSDIPLTIADINDLTWSGGVLGGNPSTVIFYDNAFTAQFLNNAEYIVCDGEKIRILNKDYKDEGWVMITLDTADGSVLAKKPLLTE